jgi:hypothetical protein
MKTLLTLLLALCAASGYGQTIRTLGFNTTNGQIVYSGTNTLTFTNAVLWNANVSAVDLGADNLTVEGAIYFTEALTNLAVTRTNLGLGAAWLTNANVTNFRSAIGLSLAALTNTNVTNFRTAIGLGATNDAEFNTLTLGGSGQMTLRGSTGNIGFYDSIDAEYVLFVPADTDPVEINSQWNDPDVRSNLGLPLAALTNTSNVTAMRALSGSTNTNHPFSGSISVTGTNNTNTLVFTNGILREVTTP